MRTGPVDDRRLLIRWVEFVFAYIAERADCLAVARPERLWRGHRLRPYKKPVCAILPLWVLSYPMNRSAAIMRKLNELCNGPEWMCTRVPAPVRPNRNYRNDRLSMSQTEESCLIIHTPINWQFVLRRPSKSIHGFLKQTTHDNYVQTISMVPMRKPWIVR